MTWAFIFYAIFINCFGFVSVLQDIMSFALNLGHIPNCSLSFYKQDREVANCSLLVLAIKISCSLQENVVLCWS